MKKLNGLRGDPYINQRPRVCHIPQGIGHGVMIACGIDHQAIPMAVGESQDLFQFTVIALAVKRMGDSRSFCKIQDGWRPGP